MEKSKSALRVKQLCCVFSSSLFFSFLIYFSSFTFFFNSNVLQSGNGYNQSVSKLFQFSKPLFLSKDGVNLVDQTSLVDEGVEISSQRGIVKNAYMVKSYDNKPEFDQCSGKYVYVHNLPSKFNIEILEDCQAMSSWEDMCSYMSNEGLGVNFKDGWFNTYLFSLDVIFHSRMKYYKCLTSNSSVASAIYVPFYPALDIVRYLFGFNTSMRDSLSHSLVKWLSNTPEWKRLSGRDHFIVAGRMTWDFRRITNEDSDWGNNLFLLPEAKNMTLVGVESDPWDNNEFAIPYPSYFHPSSDIEVFQWQSRMRKQEKKYLFCFAGAPRPDQVDSVRSQIIEQCQSSKGKCGLLDCDKSDAYKCHSPTNVMELFQNSLFCLQPRGDCPTRRSTFDSFLAGCIPVFFHPASAYTQYILHLPQNYSKYSVYIPEDDIRNGKVSIESILNKISDEEIREMREEIISLIPKLIYAHPKSRMETIEDSFDIAIKGVIERVDEARKEIKEGWLSDVNHMLENSWKYKLWGRVKEHEWDHFFGISKPKNENA